MTIKSLKETLADVKEHIKKDSKSAGVAMGPCYDLLARLLKELYNGTFKINNLNVESYVTHCYGPITQYAFAVEHPFEENKIISVRSFFEIKIKGLCPIRAWPVTNNSIEIDFYENVKELDYSHDSFEYADIMDNALRLDYVSEFINYYMADTLSKIGKRAKIKINEMLKYLENKESKIKNNAPKKITTGLCKLIKNNSLNISGDDIKILTPYLLNKRSELQELIAWVSRNKRHFKYATNEILEKISDNILVMDILE